MYRKLHAIILWKMSDNHYRREIFDRFPDIYKYLFREEIMKKDQEIFQERLNHHHDELRWLYTELYHNDDMFAELCDQMYQYFTARRRALKNRDLEREKNTGLVPPEGYAWHDALY